MGKSQLSVFSSSCAYIVEYEDVFQKIKRMRQNSLIIKEKNSRIVKLFPLSKHSFNLKLNGFVGDSLIFNHFTLTVCTGAENLSSSPSLSSI